MTIKTKSMNRFPFAVVVFLLVTTTCFAQSPGFFVDNEEKPAIIPPHTEYAKPTATPTVTVNVNAAGASSPVSKYIYGNNANPYMTQMVDQPVLLDHIKELSPNVIRFPGGNLSSIYFWDAAKDSPPADAPAKLVNSDGAETDPGYWYGGNQDSWTLSLANYYNMLQLTGNTGMITVNYGYARYSTADDPVASAAHYAAEWVRHDNGRTKFWEIGNESNGSWQAGWRINTANNRDGQPEIITGALYGKHFRVFADSMRKAANEIGAEIFIGAQLLAEPPANWWTNTDKNWNAGVFQEAQDLPDYYIIHSYYTPYNTNSNAISILNTGVDITHEMMEYVTSQINSAGRQQKPIALTEWNIFAVGSKQQISYINGMHAAIVLGELIKNKYGMASRWDFANGYNNGDDHGMFSQGDEPGIPKWNPRPSFYYMYYFQKFFGNQMIASQVTGSPDVLSYASTFSSGECGIVLVNKGTTSHVARINLSNHGVGERYYYYTLTGGSDNGEFSLKVNVNGVGPTLTAGGPPSYKTLQARSSTVQGGVVIALPPRSVVYLMIDQGEDIITSTGYEESKTFQISPNPASGRVTVDLPFHGFQLVEVSDLRGRVFFTHPIMRNDERVSFFPGVPPGMYIVRLRGQRKIMSAKLVIEQ